MNPKIIKVEDHYLTIKNYKEPLRPIPKKEGHGFYGCILITTDGRYIQCHICGKLFEDAGFHARQAHKISLQEYRERYGLSGSTALISENIRQERKERTLKWLKSLTKEQKEEFRLMAKEGMKNRNIFKKESLESKNKKGTCPDQLLAKIKEVALKIGHTPTLAEFIDITDGQRYKHLILTTFGSWNNALKMGKFVHSEKRIGKRRRYESDELLEYLSLYARENNKLPTATDCKRGLLPDYATYQRRFGTFEKARELAGVRQIIN